MWVTFNGEWRVIAFVFPQGWLTRFLLTGHMLYNNVCKLCVGTFSFFSYDVRDVEVVHAKTVCLCYRSYMLLAAVKKNVIRSERLCTQTSSRMKCGSSYLL